MVNFLQEYSIAEVFKLVSCCKKWGRGYVIFSIAQWLGIMGLLKKPYPFCTCLQGLPGNPQSPPQVSLHLKTMKKM